MPNYKGSEGEATQIKSPGDCADALSPLLAAGYSPRRAAPDHNAHSTFSKAATVAQVSIFGLVEDALADVRAVLARTAASGE
ncbi:hypothetical protein OKW35_006336 [Paraburkholderia sp. MM5477-R1]